MMRAIFGVALALASACAVADALAPERVAFDSLDADGAGRPVRIEAFLFRPGDASAKPRPAVVALHGCGGMYSTLKSRAGQLSQRHQGMAELLVAQGYIVLFPDSFHARGLKEICTIRNRERTVKQPQRMRDAQGALRYLQARPDVDHDRIAVLGWSNGGSTVLAAMNARQPSVAAWREQAGRPAYFRAAAVFYPGCIEQRDARDGYALAAPLVMFLGGSDNWTAPGPCIELAKRLAARGEPVNLTVYRGTYHDFDAPNAHGTTRMDVPNGVHPGQGVTIAPNPDAKEDAYAQLKAFLRASLAEPAVIPYWRPGP